MTCREFLDLMAKDPGDCTNAEVAAICFHLKECKPCSEENDKWADRAQSKMSAEEFAILEAECEAVASRVVADEEAMEAYRDRT